MSVQELETPYAVSEKQVGYAIRPGYKQTEVGLIPNDWHPRPLGELVTFLDGLRRPVKSADRARMHGRFPYYGASGIVDYVNDYLFDEELILLGEDGENILSRATRLAFQVSGKIWVNNHAHVLRPNADVNITFLTEILEAQDYSQYNSGTAQPKLNKATCKRILLPFPPTLGEQEAIAEALGDADALVESLERLLAKKRNLKQAAMQQLLTGKKRLPGFEGEWEVSELRGRVTLRSGHHVLAQYCNQEGLGTPYLTGPSDFPDGVICHSKFTTKPTTLCQKDDILVTVKGSGCGTLVKADSTYCISRQLMAITVQEGDFRFIYYSLLQNASDFQDAAAGLIPGLSRSDVLGQELPFPPSHTEQTAIATILSDMDAEITAIEAKIEKARQIKAGMMQELLTGKTRLVAGGPAS